MTKNSLAKLLADPVQRGPLNHGHDFLAIPGPSVVPQRVLSAMTRPMTDIYSGELVGISVDVFDRLPGLAGTDGYAFALVSNGHGAWQMAIDNTLSRGDKVLVLEAGRFATIWGETAAQSGVDVEVLPGTDDGPVDPAALQARLAADTGHEIRAVLAVQIDTASSVRNDIPALRAAIDAAGHPTLFMVDCIGSLACEPYRMDEWGVDVTVGATQKGLMTPPGLGFVWMTEAVVERGPGDLKAGYTLLDNRIDPEAHYSLYGGTPPVSLLWALSEALSMIDEEGGLPAVWARHEALASVVWAAVEAWSCADGIGFNITDPGSRSTAVTTVRTGSIDPVRLREVAQRQGGVTLGLGIGGFPFPCFRIGHMGHLNPPMLLGTIGVIEAALRSMGAPMASSGVEAATARVGELFV